MGRAALSRQITAGDLPSAAELSKRRQSAGDCRGVSGMDGFKERSVALYKDAWMERGYAVLAFEGPGYWEPPLRGIYVDVPGWAEAARTVADWLVKRPEIDTGKIGMTGVSYGSFFTAIMMAADSRYKACAVRWHLLRARRRNDLQSRLADLQEALHVHVRHYRRTRVRRIS